MVLERLLRGQIRTSTFSTQFIIARRAYCVEVPEIVVRHVSASVCRVSGRYERGMDICPDFVTPTSPKRFCGQSSEPVVEPEFGTFRGSKAVFADSKNDHFLIIFVFFLCSDPKFGTFRGSKAVLAVPIRIGTSGHLPCGCNLVTHFPNLGCYLRQKHLNIWYGPSNGPMKTKFPF